VQKPKSTVVPLEFLRAEVERSAPSWTPKARSQRNSLAYVYLEWTKLRLARSTQTKHVGSVLVGYVDVRVESSAEKATNRKARLSDCGC